jgi:hypothetical protein
MLTKEDAEAMARAQVLESAAKVEKLLAQIQATLESAYIAGLNDGLNDDAKAAEKWVRKR